MTYLALGRIVFGVIIQLSQRLVRLFQYVAVAIVILTILTRFLIDDAPGGIVAMLLLMNVLAGGVRVWVMTRAAAS